MQSVLRMLMALTIVTLSAAAGVADVKLHPLFSDNVVLQRNARVTIWGTADAGEDVRVWFADQDSALTGKSAEIKADAKGNWHCAFETGGATERLLLKAKGKNEVTFTNVALGDVWLCSGQSNMEWKLSQLGKDDQGKTVAANAANKNLRLFTVPNRPFREPQSTFPVSKTEGLWLECTPESAINFSAVGYFFGRDIAASQKVPVGLIAADWGGTPCEAWTSKAGLGSDPLLNGYLTTLASIDEAQMMATYEKAKIVYDKALEAHKVAVAKAKADNKPVPTAPRAPTKPQNGGVNQNTPTALYNGMIAPIQHFKIKGAIWYQGESNASRAKEYRTLYPAMIKDWRKQWGEDFPFFTVQLAPFRAEGSEKVSYAELRDAQTHACTLPKVGMAVITDAGDETDIHPQRKEPVGQRLALAARAIAYGEKIEYSGPMYKAMTVEGAKAIVSFDHLGGGLKMTGDRLHGFAVCGEDKVFHPATAEIKSDKVTVSSTMVAKPVAVRFGWVNFATPELNFFNKAGLPAVPFRTDDFPLTTK